MKSEQERLFEFIRLEELEKPVLILAINSKTAWFSLMGSMAETVLRKIKIVLSMTIPIPESSQHRKKNI